MIDDGRSDWPDTCPASLGASASTARASVLATMAGAVAEVTTRVAKAYLCPLTTLYDAGDEIAFSYAVLVAAHRVVSLAGRPILLEELSRHVPVCMGQAMLRSVSRA